MKFGPHSTNQSKLTVSGVIRRQAIEDLGDSVRTFCNLESAQLEPGKFRGRIEFLAGKNALLYRECYSHRTHSTFELLGNWFGFSIPAPKAKGKFLGVIVDDSKTPSGISGETLDMVIERNFEQVIVLFDHERLLKKSIKSGLSENALQAISVNRKWKTLHTQSVDTQAIRLNVNKMLDMAISGKLNLSINDFENTVFDLVMTIIDSGPYRMDRYSAAILVRRAIDFCESVSDPVGISELSTTLNVSPRTLQLAFQKVMGTTPHNFFHRRRMTKARMALLTADSRESRVSDIANNHGFSELGRFSVQYREFFGESPKVTLRRNLTSTVAIPFPSGAE